MARESYLLAHDACLDKADKLKSALIAKGGTVRCLRCDQKNALDLGREAFYELSQTGATPIVVGFGHAVALAVAIAQRCPAKGLMCFWPEGRSCHIFHGRLTREAARNLFMIVAPTLLVIDDTLDYLARRLLEQMPAETLTVVEADRNSIMSPSALNAILNDFVTSMPQKSLYCVKYLV